jgi:hypothetical protein
LDAVLMGADGSSGPVEVSVLRQGRLEVVSIRPGRLDRG